VGLLSGFSVVVIGTSVGLVAGYYKGTVDLVLMRVVDILYGISALPLILIVAMVVGSSVWVVIIGMMLILWRTLARVMRAQVLSLSERPFVKSARAVGASDLRIMYVHILPNLIPLMLIEGTFMMGSAILLEASISFLGLGASEVISWGLMLQLTFSTGAIYAWWWIIPPGVSITLTVLAFFYVARGVEDVTNPEEARL
jgi:peptide/nickel transport system permease protein